jgi:predicted PolB exonuclease-like 3'-5' exonuclease
MKQDIKRLYFDIETVRGKLNINPDDIKAPSNYSDPVKINAYRQKKIEELRSKAGLNSFTAKICSISWAIDDGEVKNLTGINEDELIYKFENELDAEGCYFEWIGHNILSFDLTFIYHRAVKYSANRLKRLMPESNRHNVYDTMKQLAPTDYKAMFKLSDACDYFGIKNPKDAMAGDEVQSYYDAGKLQEIGYYCSKDVKAVRELHLKLIER